VTNARAIYYTDAGEERGPLPAFGNWPSVYEGRGLHLYRPQEAKASYCALEDCEQHQDHPDATGFATLPELLTHAREVHGAEVWKNLETGEIAYQDLPPSDDEVRQAGLSAASVKELQALAQERGLPYVGVKRAVLIKALSG
jgi:hypothetical protein